ncbi:probable tRNA-dihydrouridine(47) synthase [NAD(P)(+)] [Melanopsichium pennsylvanicum]|uniref:tRNA-dihydrouridine(47) synthase [NAD(P)(+)] n=2 Tax=Melanopsichium pennsylvanicum TaxID=63383 RepID=A0AAJ4XK74_9BASI|nr:probable tRNA-dihydrouridine(47) synthase [NAD(P)(+)] [Melanopsichium pennsylvanicum]
MDTVTPTQTAIADTSASSSSIPISAVDSEWKHPVYGPTDKYTPGIAPIKPEYILHKSIASSSSAPVVKLVDDDAAERSTNPATAAISSSSSASNPTPITDTNGEPPKKLKGAARKRARREEAAALAAAQRAEKKSKPTIAHGGANKGAQNKARHFNSIKDAKGHCHAFLSKGEQGCKFAITGGCRFSHDLVSYLQHKDKDLFLPPVPHAELERMSFKQKEQWLEQRYSLTLLPAADGNGIKQEARNTEGEDDERVVETFVKACSSAVAPPMGSIPKSTDPAHHSLDPTTTCPIFAVKGFCTMAWKCRFLGSHVRIVGPSSLVDGENAAGFAKSGLELVRDQDKLAAWRRRSRAFSSATGKEGLGQAQAESEKDGDQDELNFGTSEGMKQMRIKKFPLLKTKAVLKYLQKESEDLSTNDPEALARSRKPIPSQIVAQALFQSSTDASSTTLESCTNPGSGENGMDGDELEELENAARNAAATATATATGAAAAERAAEAATTHTSIDLARIRPSEKRRLQWKNDLYLAPLTTTGNLPFRRICTGFGSDIHCGEMGLAESFLHGNSSEWSLVRRHESERVFGTQLCGGKPDLLVPVAEALKAEVGDGLDFVDINCGCPIDLVFNKGGGSALLDHPSKLSKIVRGMNSVLGDTPLTIKLRTGTGAKQTTHKLFGKLQTEWGASAATLHGRSRKQRYKNDADWSYIRTCAETLRTSVNEWNEESRYADEAEMVPIPVYGNGDVYSWQDYYERMEKTRVDGEMIARGALIKPWLFTEIKQRRDWDISSRERLDIMRNFAEYGLNHWGSDTHGVNTTRRFMCEMMSFTHRYVPTGLLEFLPARLNDRPPLFKGRDQLETLLASSNSNDWVKITEMFLGKSPIEWNFTPKHKSSSYSDLDSSEQQG